MCTFGWFRHTAPTAYTNISIHIEWQTEAISQAHPSPLKPWFRRPEHQIYLNTLNEAERNDIQTYEGNAHSLRIVASLECIRRRAECA